MRRTCFRLTPAFALLGAVLVGCANDETPKGKVEVTEVRAQELEKALKDQKGKVVLVDCWATWCPPCVKSFPQLVDRHKKYAEKGLACVSLCVDKYGKEDDYDKEKVVTFLKDRRATMLNFIVAEPKKDEEPLLKLLGDFSTIPYMALFDRNGRRVWESDERPRLTEEQLNKKIEELLADKP